MEACRLVERHRFLLLELNECYGTYTMRRDQTAEALEQLKNSERRMQLGESPNESPITGFKQVFSNCGIITEVNVTVDLGIVSMLSCTSGKQDCSL